MPTTVHTYLAELSTPRKYWTGFGIVATAGFFDLTIHALSVGVPAQLLQNRPDIRQAEREVEAAGLDVLVVRARFFPKVDITAAHIECPRCGHLQLMDRSRFGKGTRSTSF